MEEIASNILKSQGFFGLIFFCMVIFCGWLVVFFVKNYMAKDSLKDQRIVDMTIRFSDSLDRNTLALNANTQADLQLAAATEQFQQWLTAAKETNEKDHKEILEYVRHGRRA